MSHVSFLEAALLEVVDNVLCKNACTIYLARIIFCEIG